MHAYTKGNVISKAFRLEIDLEYNCMTKITILVIVH